jgi:hypothetical protein
LEEPEVGLFFFAPRRAGIGRMGFVRLKDSAIELQCGG